MIRLFSRNRDLDKTPESVMKEIEAANTKTRPSFWQRFRREKPQPLSPAPQEQFATLVAEPIPKPYPDTAGSSEAALATQPQTNDEPRGSPRAAKRRSLFGRKRQEASPIAYEMTAFPVEGVRAPREKRRRSQPQAILI